MTDTKRVDELEVGDVVIFPGCKGMDTISKIEKITDWCYEIFSQGISNSSKYAGYKEVTYLGNKKEEENMTTKKVDCTVLYPYLDALIYSEPSYHVLDLPYCLNKELTTIYELFEGVLELTLGEVKTLYFERKMSKSDEKTTNLVNRQELKSKVFYNGYELDVTTRLFILKDFYELDKESVPDSSTTYYGSCEEIDFNVYLSTSIDSLVSRFKEAVEDYIQAKHPNTLM